MLVDVCVAGTVTRLVDAGAIVAASAEADGSGPVGAIVAASTEAGGSGCGGVTGSASSEVSSAASGASDSSSAVSVVSAEASPPFAGSARASIGVSARITLSSTDIAAVQTEYLLSFSVPIIVFHQPSGSRDDNRQAQPVVPGGL